MTEILSANSGIIVRIIGDVIAFGLAYTFSFIGCDVIYNNFRISQSVKSAYWFFLGPFLWKWQTAIPWVVVLLKNLVSKEWTKVEDKLKDYLDGLLFFSVVPESSKKMIARSVDEQQEAILENFSYLQNVRGKYSLSSY